jgi:AcrR family transcriptional regulator
VAKGTIYLHWSTREALFVALFHREQADMLIGVRDRLSHGSATFRDLSREVSAALARWPLVRAALLGDSEVLGGLLRERRNRDVAGDMREGLAGYLRTLVENGALRSDLSPAEHANIIAAVMYGFYRVPRSLLVDDKDDERLPDLVADTLQRTLGADAPLSVDVIHTVSAATFAYLDGAIETAQQKLERSLGGPEVAG